MSPNITARDSAGAAQLWALGHRLPFRLFSNKSINCHISCSYFFPSSWHAPSLGAHSICVFSILVHASPKVGFLFHTFRHELCCMNTHFHFRPFVLPRLHTFLIVRSHRAALYPREGFRHTNTPPTFSAAPVRGCPLSRSHASTLRESTVSIPNTFYWV